MGVLKDDMAPFTGPFAKLEDSLNTAIPGVFDVFDGLIPIYRVVLERTGECETLWATVLLASCPEQTAFLCAIFSPWNPKDDPDLVEALRAGIRAGLFSVLAKFALMGDEHKLAKATAKALVIGVKHGRTLK